MELDEQKMVSDLFSYRKNEVKVVCEFQTLLEYF